MIPGEVDKAIGEVGDPATIALGVVLSHREATTLDPRLLFREGKGICASVNMIGGSCGVYVHARRGGILGKGNVRLPRVKVLTGGNDYKWN